MRILLGLFALAPLALQFCGASDEPPPPPSLAGAPAVTASAAITLPAASHGGTVLAVEDRPVEVVVASDGQVNAWLPGPPPPPNTTLSVQVNTVAGPKMTTLQWNATTAVFEGEVVGSAPAPGPIEVGLTFDGRLRHGHANRVVVVRQRHPRAHVDVRVQAPQPPQPRLIVRRPGGGVVGQEQIRPVGGVQQRQQLERARLKSIINIDRAIHVEEEGVGIRQGAHGRRLTRPGTERNGGRLVEGQLARGASYSRGFFVGRGGPDFGPTSRRYSEKPTLIVAIIDIG